MANTIKHKRASGSNPSASDLVVGELAIRTDTGVVFTKKDDNSVAEIAGGGETNLGVSTTTTAVTVTSDTGTNAAISEASGSAAGVMSVAHHDKLDGIANSATNVTNTNQLTNGAGFITATLTEEQVEDFVGGMVTGNTETGIAVTYQDSDGTLDFVVASQTDNNFTTTLKNKLDGIAASATNVTNNNQLTNGAGYITSTLTEDQVEDFVGGMVTGNTESGITVTYQDDDGTLDFVVASQTDNNFTTTLKNKLDGIEASATADQSASEIKTAYESNSDTNAFTDTLLSKLNGIAASATNVTNNNQLTNGAGYITATLTDEEVEDIVGGMVTGNTESGITVTYQDSDGTLDFSVASQTDNNFTTTLKNKLDGIAASATNVTNTNQLTNGAGFITATLTEEQVEDFVGGMVTGNTETGITVTYQDSDGTLDFAVTSQTDNNFTTTLKNKLDGIAASATNVTNNNQLTNGASYVTSSVIDSLNASNLSSGTVPDARFPSTLPAVSGANLTNISATVASGCIYENSQTISSNYTVTSNKNAMSAGPITVNSGVTVTVGSTSTWTIV